MATNPFDSRQLEYTMQRCALTLAAAVLMARSPEPFTEDRALEIAEALYANTAHEAGEPMTSDARDDEGSAER